MEHLITSPVLFLVIQLVFLIVFAIVIFILFKKILKRYASDDEISYPSRIIAVGVNSIFFSQTLFKVVVQPIIISLNNITELLNYIAYAEKVKKTTAEPDSFNMYAMGNSITSFFRDFPIGKVLLALGVGVILYRFILYCFEQLHNSTIPSSQTGQGQNAFVYNLLILLVLVFSLFLVISVFISIPYLNEIKKPSIFTKGGLDTALNSIRLSDSGIVKKDIGTTGFPQGSVRDTVLKDVTTLAHYQLLPIARKKEIDQLMTFIDNEAKFYDRQRAQVIAKINTGIDQFGRDKPVNKEKLILSYERFAQSNAVDKDLLFTTYMNAYRNYVQVFRNNLNQAYDVINNIDASNSTEYSFALSRINNAIADTVFSNPVPSFAPQFQGYNNTILEMSLNFEVPDNVSKRDGSDWGVFGLIARFLIKTESLDLVLLIGMLGFGLLGASFSSFQTAPSSGDQTKTEVFIDTFKTKPIVKDFWNVLARGFSAAILIYLATKGGIAILTANVSTDPNGYVLLLLCFVGAVFSEKVWLAAKNKYGL